MSVHGEYSRALEHVIACLRAVEGEAAARVRESFEGARIEGQPDLSQAARSARDALGKLSALDLDSPRLAESAEHLQAHCRVILGAAD